MVIGISNSLITVLFTDGDVEKYNQNSNKLKLLNVKESLAVGEKILEVLGKLEQQNTKIEEQKAKINTSLIKLLQ